MFVYFWKWLYHQETIGSSIWQESGAHRLRSCRSWFSQCRWGGQIFFKQNTEVTLVSSSFKHLFLFNPTWDPSWRIFLHLGWNHQLFHIMASKPALGEIRVWVWWGIDFPGNQRWICKVLFLERAHLGGGIYWTKSLEKEIPFGNHHFQVPYFLWGVYNFTTYRLQVLQAISFVGGFGSVMVSLMGFWCEKLKGLMKHQYICWVHAIVILWSHHPIHPTVSTKGSSK